MSADMLILIPVEPEYRPEPVLAGKSACRGYTFLRQVISDLCKEKQRQRVCSLSLFLSFFI